MGINTITAEIAACELNNAPQLIWAFNSSVSTDRETKITVDTFQSLIKEYLRHFCLSTLQETTRLLKAKYLFINTI